MQSECNTLKWLYKHTCPSCSRNEEESTCLCTTSRHTCQADTPPARPCSESLDALGDLWRANRRRGGALRKAHSQTDCENIWFYIIVAEERRSEGAEERRSAPPQHAIPRCSFCATKTRCFEATRGGGRVAAPNWWGSKWQSVYQKIGGGGTPSRFKLTLLF